MQLAIPRAPRPVRLSQVPGAFRRLGVVALLGLVGCLLVGWGAAPLARWAMREGDFLARAVVVDGVVTRVWLPPPEEREGTDARLDVRYAFGGREHSATGVLAAATWAEGVGPGANVRLLVDARTPTRPREEVWAKGRSVGVKATPYALGAVALAALVAFALELRRTLQQELHPFQRGALVWLTPDEPLSQARHDIAFRASYLREDVRYEVRARGRPGRAPVRNGEKLLGAVVPSRPGWARLIDEDLARTLGWVR